MAEGRTLSTLLVILVVITSFIMVALMGIYSPWLSDYRQSAAAISFFLVQTELILITILLLRFRSSIEEIESES